MAPQKRSRSEEQKQQPSTTSSRVLRSSTTNKTPTVAPIVITKKKAATPAKKKPKTKAQSPVEKAAVPALEPHEAPKTIVIEHCKQCNQFKTRAIKVKEALENGIAGITVLVNPEKPRRGCFEVREDGGEIFISLLDMKRPFSPMRALDMDKVIYDIIDKIKK